jgi:hypothetical protein
MSPGAFLRTMGYLVLITAALKASMRQVNTIEKQIDPLERLPPAWWGGPLSATLGAHGAAVGDERLLDVFGGGVRFEDKCARAVRHI